MTTWLVSGFCLVVQPLATLLYFFFPSFIPFTRLILFVEVRYECQRQVRGFLLANHSDGRSVVRVEAHYDVCLDTVPIPPAQYDVDPVRIESVPAPGRARADPLHRRHPQRPATHPTHLRRDAEPSESLQRQRHLRTLH